VTVVVAVQLGGVFGIAGGCLGLEINAAMPHFAALLRHL
jgi:hypothetical protein